MADTRILRTGPGRASRVIACLATALLAAACSHPAPPPVKAPLAPGDLQAEQALRKAMSSADSYFLSGSSYTGFDRDASLLDPSVAWNTSPVAAPGQVSIRDETGPSIVLVTKSVSGTPFCIALRGLGGKTEGRVDAATAAQCTGGW